MLPLMNIERGAKRFEAELAEGHKGVVVAIVPFDPGQAFGHPVRLAGRRHGWLVKGTMNGAKLDGYIGERWGRFFVIVDDELLREARAAIGDRVTMRLSPTANRRTWERAIEQSKRTTQPTRARAGADGALPTSAKSGVR